MADAGLPASTVGVGMAVVEEDSLGSASLRVTRKDSLGGESYTFMLACLRYCKAGARVDCISNLRKTIGIILNFKT